MKTAEALTLLSRMREAAPAITAKRLGEMAVLLHELEQSAQTPVAPRPKRLHQRRRLPMRPLPLPESLDLTMVIQQTHRHLINSFSVIEGQASSLRVGRLGRLTSEQADALKLVMEYASTGAVYLDRIHQLSQIRNHSLRVEMVLFSPLDAAADAWQRASTFAEARQHQRVIMADDPLPFVRGDYQHTLSILIAMIDNAIRYTPVGGEIKLSVNTLGSDVLFNVADNGIGIGVDDQKLIGTAFWRALQQPLVRQYPGSGLSLFVSRLILRLMGGDLFFSGELGVGSTFSFLLPADTD